MSEMPSVYLNVFGHYQSKQHVNMTFTNHPNHSLINLLCAFSKLTYTELEEKHLFVLLLRNQYNLHSEKNH